MVWMLWNDVGSVLLRPIRLSIFKLWSHLLNSTVWGIHQSKRSSKSQLFFWIRVKLNMSCVMFGLRRTDEFIFLRLVEIFKRITHWYFMLQTFTVFGEWNLVDFMTFMYINKLMIDTRMYFIDWIYMFGTCFVKWFLRRLIPIVIFPSKRFV